MTLSDFITCSDFDYVQLFHFALMNYQLKNLELIIVKHQGRVVQSPIKLTHAGLAKNFELIFVTFRCGFPFVLFARQFEV